MADRPLPVLGSLNQSLASKQAQKFDPVAERQVREWMAEKFDGNGAGPGAGVEEEDAAVKKDLLDQAIKLQPLLKNGEILCKYGSNTLPCCCCCCLFLLLPVPAAAISLLLCASIVTQVGKDSI